jgi:NADH-quinone oxidoreductase subunit D
MTTQTVEINVGDVGARGAEASAEAESQKMALNVGPSHPTTHGVLRLMMDLDGDVIRFLRFLQAIFHQVWNLYRRCFW